MSANAAAQRATRSQVALGVLVLCLAAGLLTAGGQPGRLITGGIVAACLAVTVLAKLSALIIGLVAGARRHEHPPVPEAALPRYSVLVPLYREADVLRSLIAAMTALDYPRDRLEVLLLVEEDDAETRDGLAACPLPPWMQVVVVPPGHPRTKPRACNHGLLHVTGELVVVFDAEDRPEPDQLRRAAAAFAQLPAQVACLQARLHIDNAAASWWSSWFACEYTTWFAAYLPGLHACGAPIPLGGTSNHFRAPVIRDLGWDPWNVAEDCDLGLRLARSGHTTGMLRSITWEEAPVTFGIWLRQRSRWTKGWVQSLLVHTRDPRRLLRDLGCWRTMWLLLVVGGQIGGLLAAPPGVVLAAAWLWLRWPLWDPAQPLTVILLATTVALVLATPLLVLAHQLALVQRRSWNLLPATVALPVYWLLMGLAAWRGTLQLLTAPFLWEKTPHRPPAQAAVEVCVSAPAPVPSFASKPLIATAAAPAAGPVLRRPSKTRWVLAGILVLASVTALATAWRALTWGGAWDAIKLAQVPYDGPPSSERDLVIEANWIGREKIEFTWDRPLAPADESIAVRATAWLTVVDGEWFQQQVTAIVEPGQTRLSIPLDGPWQSRPQGSAWSPQLLMRVRSAGIRILTSAEVHASAQVATATVSGQAPLIAQAITAVRQLDAARCQEPAEFRCTLARAMREPFNPAAVQVRAQITASTTSTKQGTVDVPGFLTRDFTRENVAGREVLSAAGPPEWAVRWTPDAPGDYTVAITCTEADGTSVTSAAQSVHVAASDLPGPVSVKGAWFRRDGAFFYPQGINLRSPHDDLVDRLGVPQPSATEGTFAMERAITQLHGGGWNLLRVWLSPSFGALEWDPGWPGQHGLGAYSLQEAWRIDQVMQAARRARMVVDLALWQHGPFSPEVDTQWAHNPYNHALGGPLKDPAAILTDATARSFQERMARYAAARWGGDPALFGWTLWVEVDGVGQTGLVDWHQAMARTLRAHDPGRHPISTEFRSATGEAEVWALPEIEYTQVAAYNTRELADVCAARAKSLSGFGKPALIEELGGHSQGGSPAWLAHEIHDGPWVGLMLPFAGSPWPWWWNVVLHHDLGRRQKLFATFIAGEDLSNRTWRHLRGPLASDRTLEVLARVDADGGFAWVHRTIDLSGWPFQPDQRYTAQTTGFAPLADDPGQLFAPRAGRVLNLVPFGLDPNRAWDIEVYDTWVAGPPLLYQAGAGRGMSVPLASLVRDAAVRIKPAILGATNGASNSAEKPSVTGLARPLYLVHFFPTAAAATGSFSSPAWATVPALRVADFHPDSTDHHPLTEVKVASSGDHLHLRWRVQDRFVRSVVTTPNDYICSDSCVEFFFAPAAGLGYCNLEINAGGTILASYIEDPTIVDEHFTKVRMFEPADLKQIIVHTSMQSVVDPEITIPTTWEVSVDLPLSVIRRYVGPDAALRGEWRANFYKCADLTSHPHWAAWSSTGRNKSFHQRDLFGTIRFP